VATGIGMTTTPEAQDYRTQSAAVADRFDRLKVRPVTAEVNDLTKTFRYAAGTGSDRTEERELQTFNEFVTVIDRLWRKSTLIRDAGWPGVGQ
jgi:hypothetical protein